MDIAAQLAAESMVLLKNENGILPLTDKKKIAVVGPMAKNGWDLLGSWCGHGKDTDVAMLYNGLATEFVGKAELRYALGCSTQGIIEKVLKKHWKQRARTVQSWNKCWITTVVTA